MERLQMMIKESENRFDEISAALVQIMSENIPTEENYRHSNTLQYLQEYKDRIMEDYLILLSF